MLALPEAASDALSGPQSPQDSGTRHPPTRGTDGRLAWSRLFSQSRGALRGVTRSTGTVALVVRYRRPGHQGSWKRCRRPPGPHHRAATRRRRASPSNEASWSGGSTDVTESLIATGMSPSETGVRPSIGSWFTTRPPECKLAQDATSTTLGTERNPVPHSGTEGPWRFPVWGLFMVRRGQRRRGPVSTSWGPDPFSLWPFLGVLV